jgi:nicotinamidase-related amidase
MGIDGEPSHASERADSPWRSFVPDSDVELYRAAGYGARAGLGPALGLLVIDMTYGFTGPRREDIREAVRTSPNACGEHAWAAVEALLPLLDAVRAAGRPVFYTGDVSAVSPVEGNVWAGKQRRLGEGPAGETEIVREIAPQPGDEVITKDKPSAFFGTGLADRLRQRGVNDVLVVGGTTSGCVRASVVDAFSHGFGVGVVADCVFDRSATSHAVNLFDMDQKYADVLDLPEAIRVVQQESLATPGPTRGLRVHQ